MVLFTYFDKNDHLETVEFVLHFSFLDFDECVYIPSDGFTIFHFHGIIVSGVGCSIIRRIYFYYIQLVKVYISAFWISLWFLYIKTTKYKDKVIIKNEIPDCMDYFGIV